MHFKLDAMDRHFCEAKSSLVGRWISLRPKGEISFTEGDLWYSNTEVFLLKFHTFGNPNNPVLLLIHGLLIPWQIWIPKIEELMNDYYLIVPALNAHVEDEATEFISTEAETEEIEAYLLSHVGREIEGIYGISMGAIIANELFCKQNLRIKTLFLDGPPLIPVQKIFGKAAHGFYYSLIHLSKRRDPFVLRKLEKLFLPVQYMPFYFKIVDQMSDESIKNLIKANSRNQLDFCRDTHHTQIIFLYGSRFTDILSKASVESVLTHYPTARVIRFDGYHHAHLCLHEDEECIHVIRTFL